jgi:hypothetical protein
VCVWAMQWWESCAFQGCFQTRTCMSAGKAGARRVNEEGDGGTQWEESLARVAMLPYAWLQAKPEQDALMKKLMEARNRLKAVKISKDLQILISDICSRCDTCLRQLLHYVCCRYIDLTHTHHTRVKDA